MNQAITAITSPEKTLRHAFCYSSPATPTSTALIVEAPQDVWETASLAWELLIRQWLRRHTPNVCPAAYSPVSFVEFETPRSGPPLETTPGLLPLLQPRSGRWKELQNEILCFGKLPNNWDEEGARPPSEETVATAVNALGELTKGASRSFLPSAPVVIPVPDGTIRFEWTDDDKELLLTVDGAQIEALRWCPRTAFEPEGMWSISLGEIAVMVEWLAGSRAAPETKER